jgi:hypothetical protein
MKRKTKKSASAKRGRAHTRKSAKQETAPSIDSVDPQLIANRGW